jgi:phage shock protein A
MNEKLEKKLQKNKDELQKLITKKENLERQIRDLTTKIERQEDQLRILEKKAVPSNKDLEKYLTEEEKTEDR